MSNNNNNNNNKTLLSGSMGVRIIPGDPLRIGI